MADEIGPPDPMVRPGGDFDLPVSTKRGGPDYGRFLDALREVQDHARAAAPTPEAVSHAADLLEQVAGLLAPFDTDEWTSPSGRRSDLPMRGNILSIPHAVAPDGSGRLRGWARFRRFHLGRNGAVHGGAIAHLFDSILGQTSYILTGGHFQRTAYLHINYRKVVPFERELTIDAGVARVEGRKIFVEMQLREGTGGGEGDGDGQGGTVLAEGEGLFVRLKPGQP